MLPLMRRAWGPAAAAAVGANCAQARAPPAVLPESPIVRPLLAKPGSLEEWVIPHLTGDQVLFEPFSIADITEEGEVVHTLFRQLVGFPEATSAAGPPSPAGSHVTDGCAADGVIEGEALQGRHDILGGATAVADRQVVVPELHAAALQPPLQQMQQQLASLVHAAAAMASDQGVQAAGHAFWEQHTELLSGLMLTCDGAGLRTEAFLLEAGPPPPGARLPAREEGALDDAWGGGGGGAPDMSPDIFEIVYNTVSDAFERTGCALGSLGHWMRSGWGSFENVEETGAPADAPEDGALRQPAGEDAGQPRAAQGPGARRVMETVLLLALVVLCRLMLRRRLRLLHSTD